MREQLVEAPAAAAGCGDIHVLVDECLPDKRARRCTVLEYSSLPLLHLSLLANVSSTVPLPGTALRLVVDHDGVMAGGAPGSVADVVLAVLAVVAEVMPEGEELKDEGILVSMAHLVGRVIHVKLYLLVFIPISEFAVPKAALEAVPALPDGDVEPWDPAHVADVFPVITARHAPIGES